jgi:hypothetical protein
MAFPHMPPESVGKKDFETAPYYSNRGYRLSFHYDSARTEGDIKRNNDLGHWLNQSFVTRLVSLLEYHSVIGKSTAIDKTIDGWRDIDLARRLRNKFSHAPGHFDKTDPEARKLFRGLSDHYPHAGVWNADVASVYPIPIDEVLEPMKDASKRYAASLLKRDHGGTGTA